MKGSKTFLLLSVLVAVLVLGVAYAAIQNITLTVTGNVTSTPEQGTFKVRFVEGTGRKVSGDGEGTFVLVADDEDKISAALDVTGMDKVGQKAIFEIQIENVSEGGLGAELELSTKTPTINDRANTTATASQYFAVEATLSSNKVAANGEKVTLTITVTMLKTPLNDIMGNFSFTINAKPVNE